MERRKPRSRCRHMPVHTFSRAAALAAPLASNRTVYYVVPDASGRKWVVSQENGSFRQEICYQEKKPRSSQRSELAAKSRRRTRFTNRTAISNTKAPTQTIQREPRADITAKLGMLKPISPDADIPIVPVSLKSSLDPAEHLVIGGALAPLRDRDVLIIGSGLSSHNPGGFRASHGCAVEGVRRLAAVAR
jgi:hypothetical protein